MPPRPPRSALAAITYERGFDVDHLLLGTCDELRLRRLILGGILQSSYRPASGCAQSVMVVDLRSGDAFNIWDNRGAGARGCKLNESGLLEAEPVLRAAIADRIDLLIINRFGRAESLGRGMIAVFAAAIEARIPVLTAVRAPYDEAWRSFHGGLGVELLPEPKSVLSWAFEYIMPARAI
jgi:uncharacterized protein DUF2478